MTCKLTKNKIDNISIFSLKEKKFIKCIHKLSFEVDTQPIQQGQDQQGKRTPSVFKDNQADNRVDCGRAHNRQSRQNKYSNNKSSNKGFLSTLKDIEDNIESYTKDEICGVIESLLNH